MQPQIIRISGSPIRNSSTDRFVQAVPESSGLTSEFFTRTKIKVRSFIDCSGAKETAFAGPRTIFKNWPAKSATREQYYADIRPKECSS